jgi:flagellar assembly factor FliW
MALKCRQPELVLQFLEPFKLELDLSLDLVRELIHLLAMRNSRERLIILAPVQHPQQRQELVLKLHAPLMLQIQLQMELR